MARKKAVRPKGTQKRSRANEQSFDCITVEQGAQEFVLFAAKVSALSEFLDVSRREEDRNKGYQRHFSPSRIRAIAKYIDEGNSIPLSILVSFDEAKMSNGGRRITVPNKKGTGWIIDGQHRYLGALEAKTDFVLPVIAFVGLDEDDQIHQFVTINREAKGVPTSLYYDLLPRLKIKKSPAVVAKERAADLAHLMRREEGSPFFNKIVVTTSPRRGELSLNNFVRKIAPLIQEDKGPLAVYSEFQQASVLDNYYSALRSIFPREFGRTNSIFFQTLGFGGLMNAFPVFFQLTYAEYQGRFTVETAAEVFREIQHFDFGAWAQYGSGSRAEIQAGDDLKAELRAAFESKGDRSAGLIVVE